MLAVAREFAEEWSELRGLHQQKLAGQLLRYVTSGRLCMCSCMAVCLQLPATDVGRRQVEQRPLNVKNAPCLPVHSKCDVADEALSGLPARQQAFVQRQAEPKMQRMNAAYVSCPETHSRDDAADKLLDPSQASAAGRGGRARGHCMSNVRIAVLCALMLC